jgi:hypothetical protein
MMKLSALLAGCLLAAAVAMPAAAQKSVYTAVLNGPSESPANTSPGTGLATVTIDTDLNTMRVEENFSGLLAGGTASHIHCCTTISDTGTASVATTTPTFLDFPSDVTAGSYDHTFDMTLASSYNAPFVTANGGINGAFLALMTGLNGGNAYVNIHTSLFPMGETRGFLHAAPVPEPETYAMLLAGLAIIGAVARRRRT